jgi:predicted nuclease of predicted toxin-antitoxin system
LVARVNVKLLLDENISPKVGEILCKDDGVDACGVRDRGLLAATDAEVLERAFSEDRILVTKNIDDFERLARARELHAGIILVEEAGLNRDAQLAVIRGAVAVLQKEPDLANRVLRIGVDGTMTFELVPPGATS